LWTSGWTSAILRRSICDQTINAFIGRFTCLVGLRHCVASVYGVCDCGFTSSDPNIGQSVDQPPQLDVDDDGDIGKSSTSPQLLKLSLRDQTDAAVGDSGTTCGSISSITVYVLGL